MSIDARFCVDRGDFTLDVDLQLSDSGITAVLGASGSGKTTLLRAIAGLEHHADGFLKIGETVWQDNQRFIAAHKRSVGYVFQEASLFPHLSVEGNIRYGHRRLPESERNVSIDDVLRLLGLQNLLQRDPHSLSGGERQRVAIARALAVSPDLLLMDEPLASLDAKRKREILPYLESLHGELDIPVIYVTHLADEAARIADDIVLLENGRVEGQGPINEMFARLDLPLVHSEDAGALIEAVVEAHDDEYQLTVLRFAGGLLTIARKSVPVGSVVRLRVAARDVSLTLERQTGTSIMNIFPAIVKEILPEGESLLTVRLSLGGVPLIARVTRKSSALLGLEPEKKVFAQVKSVALLQ